jgi:hypothetical protein
MVEVENEIKKREYLLPEDIDITKYINNNPKATG